MLTARRESQIIPNLGQKFSLVNVQISSTDTTSLDLYQDIVFTESGDWDLDNSIAFRLVVSETRVTSAHNSFQSSFGREAYR
jgi:hypothetical protein